MAKFTLTASLDTEKDADILRWIDAQENTSAAVRQALRNHISGGLTLGDLHQAIQQMKAELLQAGLSAGGNGALVQLAEGDEDPEVAAALDALANL